MNAQGRLAKAGRVRLRILATSDLHAHILGWNYHTDTAAPDRGLARIAGLVRRLRRGADATLLVDNGDFLQGSPLGDAAALRRAKVDGLHPMIAAMNAMGYDAAALGNHEFSHGLGFMLQALGPARFPVLSANILTQPGPSPLDDTTLLPASHLLHRDLPGGQRLAIGIIGLTPPQTLMWERAQIDRPLQARDLAEAAAAHAADLRRRGADVVLALCHSGLQSHRAADQADPLPENAAAIVAGLPGIDALVAGHTHQAFPSPDFPACPIIDPHRGRVHGRPVVAPGFYGSHLGVIDLVLAAEDAGWRIKGHRARLHPVARRGADGRLSAVVGEDPALRAATLAAHEATRRWSKVAIGAATYPISSHFALITPTEAVRLVARAQGHAVAMALADTDYAGLPVVSAASPYHAGGRGGPENYTALPAGALTLRHLTELYPHPNSIAAIKITGAELANWLERSAALFRAILPSHQDQPLINPDFASFNFDMVEGVTYRIDLTAPRRFDAMGRLIDAHATAIRDLALDGRPLAPDMPLILATNSYRLSGAGGFMAGLMGRVVYQGRDASRDVLQRHISANSPLAAPDVPNWHLWAPHGTSVTFDTAPDAMPAPGLDVQPLDMRQNGFRRFRLQF